MYGHPAHEHGSVWQKFDYKVTWNCHAHRGCMERGSCNQEIKLLPYPVKSLNPHPHTTNYELLVNLYWKLETFNVIGQNRGYKNEELQAWERVSNWSVVYELGLTLWCQGEASSGRSTLLPTACEIGGWTGRRPSPSAGWRLPRAWGLVMWGGSLQWKDASCRNCNMRIDTELPNFF